MQEIEGVLSIYFAPVKGAKEHLGIKSNNVLLHLLAVYPIEVAISLFINVFNLI